MSEIAIGGFGIALLLLLMLIGMPIAFAMALIGFAGVSYLNSTEAALYVMGAEPFGTVSSDTLSVLPLFLLMGSLCVASGASERLFKAAHKWMGHLPGGLSMAAIGGCAGFAAICGSSLATAATAGAVVLPEMRRYKYDMGFATGSLAAGGTLGILIPPSGIMIIYGILTEQSIGKLFIAGILPGVLLASLFIITIYILVKRNPLLVGLKEPKARLRDRIGCLLKTAETLALFILVMGGLYGGLFTVNEAAGVGAAGAFLIGCVSKRFSWSGVASAFMETIKTSAMIFAIIIGAMIFNRFLVLTQIPQALADFAGGLSVPWFVTIICILLIYVVLGCFFDGVAITLLTIPIFYRVVLALDLSPIWFGVLYTIMMETAAITPPLGMNVYVLSAVAPDVKMTTIFRGALPFLLPLFVTVILLMLFPQVALFLPDYMR